ncbi:MAG TPA: sensor histidine kinase [Clostridium sp.]|nr:sensor histidine kinase [Clostridium sp.]
MGIGRFIKEKSLSIVCFVTIFVVVNLFLFCLTSFKNNLGDLIYIDFIITAIYLVFIFMKYSKSKKAYGDLYKLMDDNKEIAINDINGESLEEEIMTYIIRSQEYDKYKNIKLYEENLRDMEEYISKWVHEIKIPISALNIISERIEDEDIGLSVKNEVEKINFLVNSVMYGSRSTASAEDIFIKEEILKDIVKQSIKNNAFFLIKNNIEIEIEDLSYNIYTDKKWLSYILDQIINNSIKYIRELGKLQFYAKDEGKYVELYIKDNGIGIAKEDIDRVFNKGFTGTNGRNTVYKSTGMGLYFSKKIIEMLEHKIEVESIQGEFTVFKIRFYKISDYLKSLT